MEPLISFRNVSHWFGEASLRKQVLFDLTADFMPGEIVILTGPSGSGKTTALTLAGGLRSVQSGSIHVFGQDLSRATKPELVRVRRKIGFIFQSHNLLNSLTATQNVQMALALQDPVSADTARKQCLAMLEAVGLREHAHKYPHQLSVGQKQRVAIARALVNKPRIILADEPTASLDKKSGREIVSLLHDHARSQKCAILLVTHDNRILDVADRTLTLEDGRLSSFAKGLTANAGQMLSSLAAMNRRGDLVHRIETMADSDFVEMLDESTAELDQLLHVLDIAAQDVSESMLEQALQASTYKMAQLLEADRGTIFLVDRNKQVLRSKVAQHTGDRPLEIVIPITQGIAGHVAQTGTTLNIPDVYQHPLFNPETDRVTGYRTQSMLCMPIYNRAKEIFAVAQMLNKKTGQAFDEEDEKRFRTFIPPVGRILESCTRLEQRARHHTQ